MRVLCFCFPVAAAFFLDLGKARGPAVPFSGWLRLLHAPPCLTRPVALSRMQLALHATRRTPHGASRLVQATPCLVGEHPTNAPSLHGHTSTAVQGMRVHSAGACTQIDFPLLERCTSIDFPTGVQFPIIFQPITIEPGKARSIFGFLYVGLLESAQ